MIIFTIILAVLIIVGLIILKLYFSSPKTKGKIGEATVASILGTNEPNTQYIINDLLFLDNNGVSRQIDHIVINQYGIWVIETKNYKGTIYGTESQKQWTQVLAYGKVKNQFYNPIKQNTTHIYSLAQKLNINRNFFHNVVVFPNKTDISNITATCVYHMYELSELIYSGNICLQANNLENLYDKITLLKSNDSVDMNAHVANIQNMQQKIYDGVCPRCGGKLILRNGKNGEFYGCSNYPRCRFTMNINE